MDVEGRVGCRVLKVELAVEYTERRGEQMFKTTLKTRISKGLNLWQLSLLTRCC